MRQIDVLAGMMGLLAVGVAAQQAGCVFNAFNDCELYPHGGCPGVGTASGTGGSTGTMSASGTGGSTDCGGDPKPGALGKGNINDDCAVFVRADATGATPDGSMANPYKLLQDAIDKPKGQRTKVFACKSMPFTEEVALASGLEVYGGFDCSQASWTWAASGRTALDGPPGKVVLTIKNGSIGALVSGWTVKATKATMPAAGTSSIAVAVDDVAMKIERSDISADDGADGADGDAPTGTPTPGGNAPAPIAAMNACMFGSVGGAAGTTTCDDGASSGGIGGTGGVPMSMTAVDGMPGADGTPADATQGKGGKGASVAMSMGCSNGTQGADGSAGAPGPGGSASGTLSLTGVTTTENLDGKPGVRAQGGGGGGGDQGAKFCGIPASASFGPGASGGGGGGGGCGGKGGGGGKAGGSSIAILSLGTNLTIDGTTVTLKTGKGGSGGKGALGQSGAGGGTGASGGANTLIPPSKNGCTGASGGAGGTGGTGGGGRGGFSAGIAFAKAPTVKPMFKTASIGTAGPGGMPIATPGNAGKAGETGAVCDFSKTTKPCM